MEFYISRRILYYTNAWWICTYEDELKIHDGNLYFHKKFRLYQLSLDLYYKNE